MTSSWSPQYRGLWFDLGDLEIVKAAIDAPFGWPEPFLDAVMAHQRGQGWPSGMDNTRAPFERRATDRFVHDECGKTPFSVSADKIAYLAMRCAALQSELRVSEGPRAVDRRGSGRIAEVYPDPALRFWTAGDPRSLGKRESYKGPLRGERRAELAAILQRRSPLSDPKGLLEQCAEEDDYLDALVCALLARAASLGLTEPPRTAEDTRLAPIEGWIHLPACGLEALTA